jgi:O-methyltransferase
MSAPDPIAHAIDKMVQERTSFFWDAFTFLQVSGIRGDYVEFGSWGGNSLKLAYEASRQLSPGRHLWAFDSFQGLPAITHPRDDRWRTGGESHGQGGIDAFYETCDGLGIPRDAYTAVEGYFEATLPWRGVDGPPSDIALAYIDCNMYSSTLEVFEFLAPRLKHGMIIAFDDYFCYSSQEVSGERAAKIELESAHPELNFVRFKDVHWAGVSFIVEDAASLPGG